MTLAVVFDTETTGLPDFKAPSDADHQPHIVQLAFVLVDCEDRKVFSEFNMIARPNGWDIPKEASDVHGITTEMAHDLGVPEKIMLEAYLDTVMTNKKLRVAHNVLFDDRLIRIAMKRFGYGHISEEYKEMEKYCTMAASRNIVKCPPTYAMIAAGRTHFKNPRLEEAYKHFFGVEMENAHDAMSDVRATLQVFYELMEFGAKSK